MRIRSRLLLVVLTVLVPALFGAGATLYYMYGEEEAFHRESMRETARAMALALDRDMARRQAVLRTLGASESLGRGELERFHAYASTVAKDTDSAIILSDLEGRQLVNTRLPYGAKLPPMLPQERENRARMGNKATVISNVYVPPAGLGPHSFAIQVPVSRDGEVVLFLTMGSFASQLQKLLAEQPLPEGWHATIADRLGVVAARSLEPERFVGQPLREELRAKITTQNEGFHEGQTLAGVHGTAFFSRAPQSGWLFLLAVPRSLLFGPANRASALMGAISLLLLGLGLAVALFVARRISQPVQALREAAERLGHNEAVEVPPLGTVELDAVGGAMAQASSRLRGTTAELERRVAEAMASFERSQRALVQAQKLDALGRLTGGIAHDFNNVLQTLSAGLQALALRAPGPERDLLQRCQRAVARGSELSRKLMAFGRVQDVRTETIDTAARLAEARQLLGGALPANVALELELEPGLWPVTVDPSQFELALLNLVLNARDAMPGGGKALLRARNETVRGEGGDPAAGDYVVVSLTDSGEGMSDEVLARAFDPFFTTKPVGRGSGMGLPQAYGFARQIGGTLKLQSARGEGTTATLYLPRARRPVAQRSAPPAAAGMPRGAGRVLLVEDDDEGRETVASALAAAGFDIRTAASADEALKRVEAGEIYDAILTDVVMPGTLNGIELAERIRSLYPGTGVVVATGYTNRAVQLPGVRTLAKPYGLEQAVEALNAAIRG